MNYDLQQHDILVLKALKGGKEEDVRVLSGKLKLDQVAVARASLNLQKQGLASVKEKDVLEAELTKEGKDALKKGLIEKQLVKEVGKTGKKLGAIKLRDKNVALGWARRKGLVVIDGGVVRTIQPGLDYLKKRADEEKALDDVEAGKQISRDVLENLKKRKLVSVSSRTVRHISITPEGEKVAREVKAVREVSRLTPKLIKTGGWRRVRLRKYNVLAPSKEAYPAKRHFLAQAMDHARRIWTDMGFREMEGPVVNTSFWNFDALFVPQDHPARDMQDTLFVDGKGRLPDKRLVARVKGAHEKGVDGSLGWRYKWSENVAKTLLLRTHTTVLSAKTLAALKKEELPAKFFALGRCFRNETVDWQHLFAFNQTEGIVVDPNANFKHLLGYLHQFFKKMGYEKIRTRPSYFPYTEMSLEIDLWMPHKKQWVEVGAAGMFRPEVVEPLLGEAIPVLAWGPGFDRTPLKYYGIRDIRELYRNDLGLLKKTRMWM